MQMNQLIDLLVKHPLLLLFLVSTIGYFIGEIRIKGTGLGIAAVLFVGLAFGALSPELTLPTELVSLGLVLFVYSVALSSGPGFFASFSRSGLRDNLMVAGVLILVMPRLLNYIVAIYLIAVGVIVLGSEEPGMIFFRSGSSWMPGLMVR